LAKKSATKSPGKNGTSHDSQLSLGFDTSESIEPAGDIELPTPAVADFAAPSNTSPEPSEPEELSPQSSVLSPDDGPDGEEPAWLAEAPDPEPEDSGRAAYRREPDPGAVDRILAGLNPPQREAVQTTEGPLLIIAGPGSGKTRVLTHRIAYLIEKEGVWPSRICAVTFTNKAAQEMKTRLEGLIGLRAKELTVGTFHSLGVRILRQYAEELGYANNFVIYDDEDQVGIVKQAMKDIGLDDKRYAPRAFLSKISAAKTVLAEPEEALRQAENYFDELAARVYRRYQELLLANHAFDFDDLIKITIELFTTRPDILRKYQERYRYVLVDEYQDTNHSQYILIKLLSGLHRNLCVVGDEDQCVPEGSMVLTPQGEVPIEQIQTGDMIISGAGRGTTAVARVQEVKSRSYSGKLVQITLRSGRVIRTTPNHICFAKLGMNANVYYVYLMYRRDKGYRIGLAMGARSDGRSMQNGLAVRTNQEHADKVWVLRVCSTREEAAYYENYYAYEYGIPTMIFHTMGRKRAFSQESIDRLYEKIDTRSRAARLMADLDVHEAYPHHRPQGITDHNNTHRMLVHLTAFGGNHPSLQSPWYRHRVWLNTTDRVLEQRIVHGGIATRAGGGSTWRVERSYRDLAETIVLSEQLSGAAGGAEIARWAAFSKGEKFGFQPASHLRPTMIVPVWQEGKIVEDEITSIELVDYGGTVYDLDVEHLHNYTVNGMVVHNSVYGWRAADIRNILNFERDNPDAKVIVLGQNYRSTQTILKVADGVIRKNTQRKQKELWTENEAGLPVTMFEAYDENEEAQYVAREVKRLASAGFTCKDVAVMYRTNAQSRQIEEACMFYGVPYQLIGGVRFYSRREVKDVIAILRVVHTPQSNTDFVRMLKNTPVGKGIGAKTLEELEKYATRQGVSFYEAMHKIVQSNKPENRDKEIEGAPAFSLPSGRFEPLLATLEEMIASRADLPVVGLLDLLLERTRYQEFLKDGTPEGEERWQNVLELRTQAEKYADLPTAEELGKFLEDVSLMSDPDTIREENDAVTLITLHAAKGLEYPVVFIVGMDEGILPHSRSLEDENQMEEERRLAYVGITRAKQRLYLVYAFRRTLYGMTQTNGPSRFLADVPADLVTGRDPGTAFQPALFGGKRNTVPESGLKAEDILRGKVSIYGSGGSKNKLTPSGLRPGSQRVEKRREEKREQQNVRLNITSAADLRDRQKGASGPPAASGFKVGEKVRHHKFGEGQVLAVKASGADEEVTVMFKTAGTKRLLASMARMERV
jgi:DNA helicase-2/ATP-dependent DNA helicase PcrA